MIAITGAAGFIGSNLAHRLAGMGYRLWLVDRSKAAPMSINWLGLKDFHFSTADQFLSELNGRPHPPIKAVFHLGACSSTTETDWTFLYQNNVEYSRRLWEWCSAARCPFYYASSAATYGDGSLGFSDRTPPARLSPLNLYGKSKNDFDTWVMNEVTHGTLVPPAWSGLKFFNVYGPREAHKNSMASVVWQAKRQVLETGETRLFRSNDPAYPDGEQRRDFVFVEDCIDHMLWLWQHPQAAGIFNSGSGTSRTFLDLACAVCAGLDREPCIRFIDLPAHLSAQYQNFTEADMSTLRGLGYSKSSTTLEEGVRRSLQTEDRLERLRMQSA